MCAAADTSACHRVCRVAASAAAIATTAEPSTSEPSSAEPAATAAGKHTDTRVRRQHGAIACSRCVLFIF
jgi:hypothetical protein